VPSFIREVRIKAWAIMMSGAGIGEWSLTGSRPVELKYGRGKSIRGSRSAV